MEKTDVVKSTQEQAVAGWINYLNQVRLERLANGLRVEGENLQEALRSLDAAKETIEREIVSRGRGGVKGMHGFIAEVAECGIGNSRALIEGESPLYQWVNDNGMVDLKRGALDIQQKFSNSGGHLSLRALQAHLTMYPDFLRNGAKYQIPADHYERIQWLLSIPEQEANKMSTATGEFSMRQWKEVQAFFSSGEITMDDLEPSLLAYREVQRGSYPDTFSKEKAYLIGRNEQRRETVYHAGNPSLQEAAAVTGTAALMEGGLAFCGAVLKKRRQGKGIGDFQTEDWKEVGGASAFGVLRGGIRGVSIYALTNYTATPAAAANAVVTAAFGVAQQAYLLRKGELDEAAFLTQSEAICMDAAVSALSSFAGQAFIPLPVLGAVIGNAVGTLMWQIAKEYLSEREEAVLQQYCCSLKEMDQRLAEDYHAYLCSMADGMRLYLDLLEQAFSPDVRQAYYGSIELAKRVGVPPEEILDTPDKIKAYFVE